MDMIGI